MRLFLIVIIAFSVTQFLTESKSPPDQFWINGLNYSDEVFHEDPTSTTITFPSHAADRRFKRDAQDDILLAYITRLQMIARVANAIHLQRQLIAHTIPANELISELLHFGPFTPSQIAALDIEKIKAAIETLNNLPRELKGDGYKEVEAAFEAMEQILNLYGDAKKWTDEQENFKTEMEELKTNGVNTKMFSIVRDLGVAADTWDIQHGKLTDTKANISKEDVIDAFGAVVTGMKDLKKYSSRFEKLGPVWKFNKISSVSGGFSPILNAVGAYNKNYKVLEILSSQEQAYLTYLNRLPTLLKPVNDVHSDLEAVETLMTPRGITNHKTLRAHTFGFRNGVENMFHVFGDVGNPWIKEIVKSEQLIAALNNLYGLFDLLFQLDTSIRPSKVGSIGSGAAIKGLLKIINTLRDISTSEATLKAGITESQKCRFDPTSTNFKDLQGKVKSLDQKLTSLQGLVADMTERVKNKKITEWCDALIEICNDAEKTNADVQKVVDNFKAYKNLGKLNDHFSDLAEIKKQINDVQAPSTIQADAQAVLDKFKFIDEYTKYFTCLQGKNQLNLASTAVLEIKLIREKSHRGYMVKVDNGMDVVKRVVGAMGHFKDLETAINKFKDLKTWETDALIAMNEITTDASVIGYSTQAVSNMHDALEKKPNVTKILDSMDLIKKTKEKLTDPDDVANLDKLISMENEIQKMYGDLDAFKQKVKNSESTTLEEQSAIFSQATSVSGIDKDLLAISASVGKLAEKFSYASTEVKVRTQLEDLEEDLKTMDTMGLQFSNYKTHLDNSKKALASMDLFFANYNSKLAPTTPKPKVDDGWGVIDRNYGSDKDTTDASETTTEKDNKMMWALIFAGVTILALAGLTYFVCRRGIKKLEENERKMVARKEYRRLHPKNDYGWARLYIPRLRDLIDDTEYDVKTGTPWEAFFDCFYSMYLYDTKSIPPVKDEDKIDVPEKECRSLLPLLKKTRVCMDGYNAVPLPIYHASHFKIDDSMELILTEGPKTWKRWEDPTEKYRTANTTWWIVYRKKIRVINMLCPLEVDGEVQCDMYFPDKVHSTMYLSGICVTCVSKTVDFDGLFETRILRVDPEHEDPHYVTHYWFLGWPNGKGVPKVLLPVLVMLQKAEENQPAESSPIYWNWPQDDDAPARDIPPSWHRNSFGRLERPRAFTPPLPPSIPITPPIRHYDAPLRPLSDFPYSPRGSTNSSTSSSSSDRHISRNRGGADKKSASSSNGSTPDSSSTQLLSSASGSTTNDITQVEAGLKQEKPSENPPVLVQCSDGAGQSGCFALLAYLVIKYRKDNSATLDFREALTTVRNARLGAVHNAEQYGFCAFAAAEYLLQPKDIAKEDTDMKRDYEYIKSGFENWERGKSEVMKRWLKKKEDERKQKKADGIPTSSSGSTGSIATTGSTASTSSSLPAQQQQQKNAQPKVQRNKN